MKSVVIGNGITKLPDNCFRDCKALASVVIGKNVETIGRNAFNKVAISVLYSYAAIPPTINTDSYYRSFNFASWDSKRILSVPSRCGTKYKSSDWKVYFENIIEMD